MSPGAAPTLSAPSATPCAMPREGSSGVEETFQTSTRPELSSNKQTSVKVPPESTPTRHVTDSLAIRSPGSTLEQPPIARPSLKWIVATLGLELRGVNAVLQCASQRRLPRVGLFRGGLNQLAFDIGMSAQSRRLQCARAVIHLDVDVGALGGELLHQVEVALDRGIDQGGHAVLRPGIDIGAPGEQHPRHIETVILSGSHKGGRVVAQLGIDVDSIGEESLPCGQVAAGCGIEQVLRRVSHG